MHYSFDAWSEPSDSQTADSRPAKQAPQGDHTPEFSFSQELQELEASLSMNLAESEQLRHSHSAQAVDLSDPGPHLIQAVKPEALAHAVANEIMNTMTLPTLEVELAKLRRQAEEYLADNRVLASQVRQLLHEKEQMSRALTAQEVELKSFKQFFGPLYWQS